MITSRTAVVALSVASVSAMFLAGCSSDSGSGGGSGNIAFIQGVSGDEFYISMQCGIEAAAKDAGVTVDTQGPVKFDPTLQKPIVDSVVASRPSAILIAPTDVAAMQAPLAAASKAGIKVVLVDTTLEDPSIAVSSISSDNKGGGAEAFNAIERLSPAGGKVLVISTDPGVSTADARVEGFEEAVGANPAFDYLGVQYSHNDPAEAARLVSAALAKDPDITGIFAANTFAAEGTATGVRQAGKQDQVKIIGFDAGPAQVKQLREGTVQALIAQQPDTIGTDGVAQAMAAINDQPVTAEISTGFHVITADNIDGEGAQYVYKSSC
ncbi:ribose ABC transporter substrate-binding protein [Rhodococcus sp. 14-2483-1-1]|uniref:ABC transporter substrate-binding protein n=1 Tax=Nocardiaceae TaxID=85025 RepID=UPI00050C3EC6|nr:MULTISPECIES: ABC transporter substrate-binding protein [Rhodococcus]OZC45560.1 ribose ABC transporter substrate-binding protein [Rhodococcus sp. WWJCD1]OZC89887.1 ribose ABC transporter substrate-binding protein [Rhodococcus sp. 06-412-2C]OZC93350.1 ribose ABC transporter substrate-binding protein [Rhodococcus sp. 06-412-2B]OZE78300.1 ribose ABC transporter substrate-binding protein [Rhodococcus sp. 15-649-2-2]OZF33069.1 ribose ABC transporter substrate-binding protein [Rhodococcus sp. 14-